MPDIREKTPEALRPTEEEGDSKTTIDKHALDRVTCPC